MKPGDVADIRIGTQLNKTSIAMSQGGASVGHVDVMSISSLGKGGIVLLQRRKRRMF
ncbi:MAG: hypothetical protein OXD45_03090 [Rhodobacteraceae bacterium]|nr:hypothetical protein [Paracoccaceae bacterium]